MEKQLDLTRPLKDNFLIKRDNILRHLLGPQLYKKDLHNPDNHSGVITHLDPDIREYEVKWALGSISMNKASGGDEIPVEVFRILKDDAVKVLCSICQQNWKT